MRRVIGLLFVVLAAASPASAQAPALRAVTFDDAIRRAIEQNPTIAQAATSVARAEAILLQARSLLRPYVTANVDSVTLDTETAFDAGVIQPRHQVAFGGTLTMPIVALARRSATEQARDQIDIATRTTTRVRQQVAVATAQAYLAVIVAQRQLEVEDRAVENAHAHLDYAQRRLEGGVGNRLNMVRAAQAVAGEEARQENSRLALRHAQEALGVLLAENGPVNVSGEPAFDLPASIDESAWMALRPDLVAQGAMIRAAERVVRDSWKDVSPFAEASFDPRYVTPSGLFQPSRSWRLTISVTQPVFQGGLQRAVKREREILFDASRIALTSLEIQARSEVRLAQASLTSLEASLASARRAAEQAQEVLRITTTAFEVGATTNIEVIDAQRSARDAESTVAQAQDAVQRARLDLLVAIGRFPQ
jgi:multidrug efflux system outer membrane protein